MKNIYLITAVILVISGCATVNKTIQPKSPSAVISIATMTELESYVRPNSLVLFDLDHTVFEGAEVYGHANWFYGLIDAGKLQGVAAEDTIRRIFPVWLKSQERNKVKPVEPDTPAMIKRLQGRGLKVMALTARQTPLISATLRQLSSIGVDFNSNSLMPAIFSSNEFIAPVAFRNGILFTSEFVKKSQVLRAYLERIAYSPDHIVFVDDSRSHVEDLVKTFDELGITVTGLHYPLVETKRATWDQDNAVKVFAICEKQTTNDKNLCGKYWRSPED